MTQPIWELYPESDENASLPYRIIMDMTIQDLLALLNGNDEVVQDIYPNIKKILLTIYMQPEGWDTPEARERAVNRTSKELYDKLYMPDEVKAKVKEGKDPILVSKKVIVKHLWKIINTVFSMEDPDATEAEIS